MIGARSLPIAWRLAFARGCAWSLLVAGWIAIGSFALALAPTVASGFALVALWLLALGAAASFPPRLARPGSAGAWPQRLAVGAAGAAAIAGLQQSVQGGGVATLLLALVGWAGLTALASGVVRRLRLARAAAPAPPIAEATAGALVAALVLGDVTDLSSLALRLSVFVTAAAALLLVLPAGTDARPAAPGCRAGLFDCSLPAWPAGAWRDRLQWPTLLAGLAMLPMMAALPLMALWCRSAQPQIAPPIMVLLHLAAMFVPVLLLRRSIAEWPLQRLAAVCAALLAAGAVIVVFAAAPLDLLGLALAHGAAWGLAWGGQLWAPTRRGRQGTSPLRAAAGYAVLTLAFGLVVERFGVTGVAATHAALGAAALAAWSLTRLGAWPPLHRAEPRGGQRSD